MKTLALLALILGSVTGFSIQGHCSTKLEGVITTANGNVWQSLHKPCTVEIYSQDHSKISLLADFNGLHGTEVRLQRKSRYIGEILMGYDYALNTERVRVGTDYTYYVRYLVKETETVFRFRETLYSETLEIFKQGPYYDLVCEVTKAQN